MQLNVLKIGYDIAAVTESHKLIEQMYPDACPGVGKLADKQVHVHQKPVTEVKPVACHRSPTPFHLREKVERKTDELMKLDIIERTDDDPTPWVNRTVVVSKPGTDDVRLCLDMREANKAVEPTRYPIKTVEEILQNLSGSKVFSKIDLKWGYHQLELDPESRGITMFVTHNVFFRYKRLIFGITSASEIYQCQIELVLAGIEGSDNISDDIIVHGEDQASHDKALHAVMRRISDNGLTVNLEKCKFHMKELEFFGMLLSEKGIVASGRYPECARNGEYLRSTELSGISYILESFHSRIRDYYRPTTQATAVKRCEISIWKRTEKCLYYH